MNISDEMPSCNYGACTAAVWTAPILADITFFEASPTLDVEDMAASKTHYIITVFKILLAD